MSNIFKPNIRWALNHSTSGSSQSIFVGESNVFKNRLLTKKPRKACKEPGAKGAKKAAAGGPRARVRKTLGKSLMK